MVRKRFGGFQIACSTAAVLALSALASAGERAASRPQPDPTPITMTAQDSTGTVWAASLRTNGLYQWSEDHWMRAPSRIPLYGAPTGMWPGPDGGVLAVTQSASAVTVMWLRGSRFKRLGDFDSRLQNRRIFATSHPNLWLTANSPGIYRLANDGHFHVVYTFQPDQFFPYRSPPTQQQIRYWPFEATTDGKGKTWFWGKSLARVSNLAPLEGFVIYDGRGFEYHRTLPGLPDHPISFLGREDDTHLWAGVVGNGLYSIDINKLTAEPVPEPEPGAFDNVTKVFSTGADTYILAFPMPPVIAETLEHRLSTVLWRCSNGKCTKALNGVDDLMERQQDLGRPWLETPEGLWLGSHGAGLWFIPSGGAAPELVNWRDGFPLESIDDLYNTGGRLLAVQLRPSRTVALSPGPLLKPGQPAAKVSVINPFSALEADPQFHIWGLLSLSGRALNEWDGQKWIAHPLPGNLNPNWLSGADADAKGRVWLFPGCMQGPVAIFNPHDARWSSYSVYDDALRAQANPVHFFNAADDGEEPAYGPGGQIAFMGACYGINYFDGRDWHLWNRPSVPGLPYFWDGPAFFDSAGKLAIDIHHETWELGTEFDWHRGSYEPEPGPLVRWFRQATATGSPPSGCAFHQATSLARDRLGRSWWTWEGSVYVGVPGRCREALSANDPQPFIDGRQLRRALVDVRGGVFLETLGANSRLGEYVALPPPASYARIAVRLEKIAPDSVRADFSSAPGALFTWRIDHGEWSPPQAQPYAVMRSLSAGPHLVEADAIDDHLNMAPVPASAKFDVVGNEQQMIAGMVSRLMHETTDDRRQADLDALAKQPAAEVLQALQAARPQADPASRWWIDAGIQQAEQSVGGANRQ